MNHPLVHHAVFYALLLIPQWVLASDEIAPLPVFPKGGAPLVAPADAASVRITGAPHVSATTTTWNEIPGSLGLQVHSPTAHPNPWNAAISFPFESGIAPGDVCLLWFYARKSTGFTGTHAGGSVLVGGGQGKHYAKAVSHDLQLGSAWSRVLVPFAALQAVPAAQGAVSIHLGEHPQQIDIAGLSLLNFGKRIALSALPQPALTYPGREANSAWRKAALQRIEAIRKSEWDAINHPASWSPANRITNVTGPSLYPDIMRHARGLSSVPMWLNEDQVFRPGRQQEDYYEQTKGLIAAGQAPDGIGIQGHFHASFLPCPEEMLRISDRFAKLVPQLQITEFDILANGDEQLQTDWFRDCMIMAFSHPAYTGFQTWGFTERTVLRKEAMPWKADWSERPLALVWKNWVGEYWHSKVRGKTDVAGQFKFRGYHGRYTVAVETAAGRHVVEVLLNPTHLKTKITLP